MELRKTREKRLLRSKVGDAIGENQIFNKKREKRKKMKNVQNITKK